MRPIRVLTWHIHGNYLLYLSRADVEFYLPVKAGRRRGVRRPGRDLPVPRPRPRRAGRGGPRPGVRLRPVPDAAELRGRPARDPVATRQTRLPRIYLEHDPPQEHPTDQRHWFDEPDGAARPRHPVQRPDVGQRPDADPGDRPRRLRPRGGPLHRARSPGGSSSSTTCGRAGRRLGADVFERARGEVPLDLVGMDAESLGGLGEVSPPDLPAFEARYRFFFNPIRWTSLGLAVLEAMTIGMPIVGLATTEMATAVENGVSGYVDTDLGRLVEPMRDLLADPAEARRLGEGARRRALERFRIDRFARDWEETFAEVAGRARPGRSRVAPGLALAAGGADDDDADRPDQRARLAPGPLGGVDGGGQNVYVGQLARHLAALGPRGRRLHPPRPPRPARRRSAWADGRPGRPRPRRPGRAGPQGGPAPLHGRVHRLRPATTARRPAAYDLIHANFFMSALVAAEVKRATGMPFVVTFHALGRVRRLHQGGADAFPEERLAIEDRAVAEADRIIAECPQDEDDLIEPLRRRPGPDRDDPLRLRPGRVLADRQGAGPGAPLGLDPDERIVLQLGRMVPRKGVDNVIRGLARLRRRPRDRGPAAGRRRRVGRARPGDHARDRPPAGDRRGGGGGRRRHVRRQPGPRRAPRITTARPTCSSPPPGTSRSASRRSRRWPAARRSSARPSAGSRPPSSTARPATSSRPDDPDALAERLARLFRDPGLIAPLRPPGLPPGQRPVTPGSRWPTRSPTSTRRSAVADPAGGRRGRTAVRRPALGPCRQPRCAEEVEPR